MCGHLALLTSSSHTEKVSNTKLGVRTERNREMVVRTVRSREIAVRTERSREMAYHSGGERLRQRLTR